MTVKWTALKFFAILALLVVLTLTALVVFFLLAAF